MEYPVFIREMSKRPGRTWTETEVQHLWHWWSQRSQLRLVWFHAARFLGAGATREDIEDAVVEFFDKLDEARRHYAPGGPDFVTYTLHVCYKNHCVRKGNLIRRRQGIELSEGAGICLEIASRGEEDPARMAQAEAFVAAVGRFLDSGALTPSARAVFALRYLEGLSYEEIAEALDVPIGSVKGWLHRGKAAAKEYLGERGWS